MVVPSAKGVHNLNSPIPGESNTVLWLLWALRPKPILWLLKTLTISSQYFNMNTEMCLQLCISTELFFVFFSFPFLHFFFLEAGSQVAQTSLSWILFVPKDNLELLPLLSTYCDYKHAARPHRHSISHHLMVFLKSDFILKHILISNSTYQLTSHWGFCFLNCKYLESFDNFICLIFSFIHIKYGLSLWKFAGTWLVTQFMM